MKPIRVERAGVVAEFTPAIDRYTHFGPAVAGGPNMLHTVDLARGPAADGGYTFFGGAYSWIAPQKGDAGWVDPSGKPRDWPPDPAMDIGPAPVVEASGKWFVSRGPVQRTGLLEEKTLRIVGSGEAELRCVIRNTSDKAVTAGPWLNSAVEPVGGVLAVRLGAGSGIWGAMGENAVEKFRGAASASGDSGWFVLPLAQAKWDDGIKVYIDPGDRSAEIAVWREGWWLHRRVIGGTSADHARLKALGEGPVAVYINPGLGIVEAELYGPVATIAPGGFTAATESWRLIRCATPDAGCLP